MPTAVKECRRPTGRASWSNSCRLDEARSRPGSGLGLSLVQGIVRLHNGKLQIGDNAPGLKVELTLPRAEAKDHPATSDEVLAESTLSFSHP